MLLIVMLESSSRSAPSNQAMLACSTTLLAWCSTIIETSCSLAIATTIECKYSRVMMNCRSCPSSASMATNQASSCGHGALRSITNVIERAIVLVVHRPSWIRRSRVQQSSRHCDRQASSSHHHRRYQQRSVGVLVVDRSLALVLHRQARISTWRVQSSSRHCGRR